MIRGNQPVEYVDETTFGVFPTEPVMQWFGLVERFTPTIRTQTGDIRYLRASGEEALESLTIEKTGQEIELAMSIKPNDLTWWAVHVLGSAGGTDDSLPSMSVGHVVDVGGTNHYGLYRGCVVRSATLTFREDDVASLDFTLVGADFSGYSDTDYIGTGSHASPSTSVLKWDDITSLTLGGEAISDYVREFSIRVDYELKAVKDVDAATSTKIVGLVPTKRDIVVGLTMDFASLDMLSDITSLTKRELVASVGDETIAVEEVAFPYFDGDFTPDDLVETTLESLPCKSISIS